MFRELYESERKKVHHLRAAQSVQQAQTTAALVDNRQVEVADLLGTATQPTRLMSHPLVSRLSTFQNVELDALGTLPLVGQPMQERGTIGNSLRRSMHLDELSPLSSAREGGHFAPEDSRKASQILGESAIDRVIADHELGARTEAAITDYVAHDGGPFSEESPDRKQDAGEHTSEGTAQMSHERFHPENLRTTIADQHADGEVLREQRGEYGQTWMPPRERSRSRRAGAAVEEAEEPVQPYDEHEAQGGGGGGPLLFGAFRGGSLSSLATTPLTFGLPPTPKVGAFPPLPTYGGILAQHGEYLAPDAGEGAEEESNDLEVSPGRKPGSGRKHGSLNKEPLGSLAARREAASGLSFLSS